MNPWPALGALLFWNYRRSTKGKSTLCSTTRKYVSPWMVVFLWCLLSAYLIPHVNRWDIRNLWRKR